MRLSREILLFLAAIWSSLCLWSSMYKFLSPLIILVPQDLNLTLYAQVCWLCCVLYSSAAFRILRPQDLQTRSERFSSLVSGNPIEPQHSAKISPTLSSLPDGENKFSNEALPPPEVKFTPQNLQLLFFWMSIFGFLPLLQTFVGVADIARLDFRRSLVSGLPSPRRTAGRVSSKACLWRKFIIKILAALLVVRNVIWWQSLAVSHDAYRS